MINKLSIYFAVLAVALGLTGCKDDKDPVYQEPTDATSFVLNTPPFAQQLYELSPDGMINFTVAKQPDYGFLASVQYGLEVSLNKTDIVDLAPEVLTSTRLTVKESSLATALCELNGIESSEDWEANVAARNPQEVFVRAKAQIQGVESSIIYSEWITLNQVQGYLAIREPGFIYLVGSPEGWKGPDAQNKDHYAAWRLFENKNSIGSQVYSAVFDMPAAPIFRFYTALTGWDADSWGSQEEDNPIEESLTDGQWSGDIVKGKGSFSFPDFPGGEMTIVVDMKSHTVQILAGSQEVIEPKYVYMVGNNAGWAEPSEANAATYEAWRLVDKTDSGIYTATFDIAAGSLDGGDTLYCRFYDALNGWGAAKWSAAADGSNVVTALGESKPTEVGEGCFEVAGAVGSVTVTLNTTTEPATVTFTAE